MPTLNLDQESLITPFVTSTERSIYALKNLSPQLAGAVISRFSRTTKGARELLATEFASDLPNLESTDTPHGARSEAFYDRVLGAYGDDSIAELGSVHVIVEGCSLFAAKAIEHSRLMSYIEQSTRYVPLDRDASGEYPYVIPKEYARHWAMRAAYTALMDRLFAAYHTVRTAAEERLTATMERPEETSVRAWKSAIQARALDIARGLLPLATKTNVGIYGNARSYEQLIYRLRASGSMELVTISHEIEAALTQIMPSMIRRIGTEKGAHQIARRVARRGVAPPVPPAAEDAIIVNLVEWTEPAEEIIAAELLYLSGHAAPEWCENEAGVLTADQRTALFRNAMGDRTSRYDRPPRAWELARYTFELTTTIAAWRDLQRHRIMYQSRQDFTARHGYEVPAEVIDLGLEDVWRDAAGNAGQYVSGLESLPFGRAFQPAYALPLCYRLRWKLSADARELYHICELRSQPQGHPEYRQIAQLMADQLQEISPELFQFMTFVNADPVPLGRLSAEQRQDQKQGYTDLPDDQYNG